MGQQARKARTEGRTACLCRKAFPNVTISLSLLLNTARYWRWWWWVMSEETFSLILLHCSIVFRHRLLPSATRSPAYTRPSHARPYASAFGEPRRKNGRRCQTRQAGGVEICAPRVGKKIMCLFCISGRALGRRGGQGVTLNPTCSVFFSRFFLVGVVSNCMGF